MSSSGNKPTEQQFQKMVSDKRSFKYTVQDYLRKDLDLQMQNMLKMTQMELKTKEIKTDLENKVKSNLQTRPYLYLGLYYQDVKPLNRFYIKCYNN